MTSAPPDPWAELCDRIREREREHVAEVREWAWCIQALLVLHAEELAARDAGHAAALEALACSEALAREETAMMALEKLMGAVVDFEVRAKRDPAGAARALCRWLERMRGTAEKGRAA